MPVKRIPGETTIGLWFDATSDPHSPAWIVSRDQEGGDGYSGSTETEISFSVDSCDTAYRQARDHAIELGIQGGLRVIETDTQGSEECIYTPGKN